ncbi:MAG TPA: HAMP domain-containing sensor histidine kinase, partial [Gammaproteobacteria bacterium]|nr:HAMP domain-containing sensor histidine kinase [Gammaproteobacteria bacterium]
RLGFFRATAFRVAAIYALVYAVLTGVLVFIVYVHATNVIETQIREGLMDESTAISSLLLDHGPRAVSDAIHARSARRIAAAGPTVTDPGRRYYILASGEGKVLTGDIPDWPEAAPASGWFRFRLQGRGEILAVVTPLQSGMKLLVGQSLVTTDALARTVKLWVLLSAALALLVGLIGGGIVGSRVMHRIRAASATAERIQAGQLSERLATGGPAEHAALARTFNAMLERIEAAVIGLRDLAARTAHEMQHPLTRADQALARAEQSEDRAMIDAEIAAARREIQELAQRNEALLRLARLEGDSAREFFREFDLARMVTDVSELYAPLAEERGRSLVLAAMRELRIVGDRQLLAQAFANLLDNALKYAPPGPIGVRIEHAANDAVLEVRDGGAGPGSDRTLRGSGLGLPIARAIAQLHGGRLEFAHDAAGFGVRLILRARP